MQKNGIILVERNVEIQNCPYCQSKDVVKYGFQRNRVQRYRCNTCGKIFNQRYGTLFYKRRLSEEEILKIVYLFLTGYPMSNMPPLFGITESTIRNILKQVVLQFQKFKNYTLIPSDYIPGVIEIDEIYIKLQGEKRFYGWLAYDPKNKFIIDFVIGKRDDDTFEELFKKLKRYRGKIKLILIDGYQGYEKFIIKYLSTKSKKPITGVINKNRFNRRTGKFYTYGLFGVSGEKVDKMVQEMGIGKTISTALIENLNSFLRDCIQYLIRRTKRIARLLTWLKNAMFSYAFFHNYLKPHWKLSVRSSKNWIKIGITPAMSCGITNKQFSIHEVLPFHQL